MYLNGTTTNLAIRNEHLITAAGHIDLNGERRGAERTNNCNIIFHVSTLHVCEGFRTSNRIAARRARDYIYYIMNADWLVIGLGIGLSAACGFRVFLPWLILNLAVRMTDIPISDELAWMTSDTALIIFGAATLCEIAAYYIPWVDHALDTIASPLAVIAGILISAAVLTDFDPAMKWTLAVIAGGGITGSIQLSSVLARSATTLGTGGIANPAVSTAETAGSAVMALIALSAPIVAVVLVCVLLAVIVRGLRRRRRSAPA